MTTPNESIPAPAPTPAAAPSASGDAPKSFQDTLPDAYKADPSFLSYKSMDDLLKSHKNLESMLGKKERVAVIPDEKSTPEEWQSYYAKIGRPEKPQDYGIKVEVPEGMPWDNGLQDNMLAAMHEAGLSKKQAEKLMAAYVAGQGAKFTELSGSIQQQAKANEETLRKEWGGAFDERLQMAKSAVRQLGGDALIEELERTGNGNNINLIKAFAEVSKMMKEDDVIRPSGVGQRFNGKLTPAEAQATMSQRKLDPEFMKAWTDRNHPNHSTAVAEMQKLMEQAFS